MAELTVTDDSGNTYVADESDLKPVYNGPYVLATSHDDTFGFKIPLAKDDQFKLQFHDDGSFGGAAWNTDAAVDDRNANGLTKYAVDGLDGHAALSNVEIVDE